MQLLKRACATKEDGRAVLQLLQGENSAAEDAELANRVLARALEARNGSSAVDAVVALF